MYVMCYVVYVYVQLVGEQFVYGVYVVVVEVVDVVFGNGYVGYYVVFVYYWYSFEVLLQCYQVMDGVYQFGVVEFVVFEFQQGVFLMLYVQFGVYFEVVWFVQVVVVWVGEQFEEVLNCFVVFGWVVGVQYGKQVQQGFVGVYVCVFVFVGFDFGCEFGEQCMN